MEREGRSDTTVGGGGGKKDNHCPALPSYRNGPKPKMLEW